MQVLELREDEEWGLGCLLHLRRLVRAGDHLGGSLNYGPFWVPDIVRHPYRRTTPKWTLI